MKLVAMILALWSGSAYAASVGEYRGAALTAQILSERLLEPGQQFSFFTYLSNQEGLVRLLGGYTSRGDNTFVNGKPNSTNMLVWHMALQGLAEEVSGACDPSLRARYQAYFRAAMSSACRWPAPDAQGEEAMQMLWLSVMGYDAPEEEFLAWRNFFLTSSYAGRGANEAVPAMLLSMLYNPHFLLRK